MTAEPTPFRLVVVTPVKDEIETIEPMMDSVLGQTRPFDQWVIVDDGSTDGTEDVLRSRAAAQPAIQLVTLPSGSDRSLGARVVDCLQRGLRAATIEDWTHWAKIDADLVLPADHFERILGRFESDPKLGIASGKAWSPARAGGWRREWTPDYFPLGMARIYRRACWEQLGGLLAGRQFDVIDVYTARFYGWTTASFPETSVWLLRAVGARMSNAFQRRLEDGANLYAIGYHPAYFLLRSVRTAWDSQPVLLAGLAMMGGYLWAALRGEKRVSPGLFGFVRREQRAMLEPGRLFRYWTERLSRRRPEELAR